MKKSLKRMAAPACFTLIALSAGASTASADTPYAFGFSGPTLSNAFELVLADLTVKAAKSAGLEVLPSTNANGDAAQQVTDISNLIANGAKGIMLALVDSNAIVPALEDAAKKGVKVVVADNPPAGGTIAMAVSVDNYSIGARACKAVGENLKGKGKVLSLDGDPATNVGRDRTKGFSDCIKKDYPGIELIEQLANWSPVKSAEVTQTELTTTPDLSAIYIQSDTTFLTGVLNVMESSGHLKKIGEPGHIYLVSVDGGAEALAAIRDNKLDMALGQPLDQFAKLGVKYLSDAVAGKKFKAGPTDHNSSIMEYQGNLVDVLPATDITKANVDSPDLWGNQK